MRRALCLGLLLAAAMWGPFPAVAADPWTLTKGVELVSRWPADRGAMREDRVTADLYRPKLEGRVPAMVIVNSSGGVRSYTERHYARVLAAAGIAALVIDSFTPRGVLGTGDDQNRVPQSRSNADAVAGFRWLAAQGWVDSSRIAVMGMSRGGEAAQAVALEQFRRGLAATDIRFAAHVAITPGGCNLQPRDTATTGAPIFFMLAELDDGTPALPCVELILRLRAAGNANVRWAVYPGVHHAHEATTGAEFLLKDWTARACAGRFFREADGGVTDRATGRRPDEPNLTKFLSATCIEAGYTIGGDERVKSQSTADLLQFLRDAEVLRDEEARAVVPDCESIPEGIHRRICVRARNGWTGDLVGLARGYRYAGRIRRDDALAARLFELAAKRGHAVAKWELAAMLRDGAGVGRDHARALRLACEAAEAGDSSGMNLCGYFIRDGIGRPKDDAAAAAWFRAAADLGHSNGMVNFARFMHGGRGGVPRDQAAAVALWRQAAFFKNPWAYVYLARAYESGEGVAADKDKALEYFRAAAAQESDGEAQRAAQEAVKRLQR